MVAEFDLQPGTACTAVDGFWRACGFPLSPAELIKSGAHTLSVQQPMYCLRLDLKEASGLVFYINAGSAANAFNDFRGLSGRANCDLVTTWCTNLPGGEAYSGGPTLRAQIESTYPIAKGEACYVDYGTRRLLNMMVYHGGGDVAGPMDHGDDDGEDTDGAGRLEEAQQAKKDQDAKDNEYPASDDDDLEVVDLAPATAASGRPRSPEQSGSGTHTPKAAKKKKRGKRQRKSTKVLHITHAITNHQPPTTKNQHNCIRYPHITQQTGHGTPTTPGNNASATPPVRHTHTSDIINHQTTTIYQLANVRQSTDTHAAGAQEAS